MTHMTSGGEAILIIVGLAMAVCLGIILIKAPGQILGRTRVSTSGKVRAGSPEYPPSYRSMYDKGVRSFLDAFIDRRDD